MKFHNYFDGFGVFKKCLLLESTLKTKILCSFYSYLNDHTIVFPADAPYKWKSTFKIFKHPSFECHVWIIASKDCSILLREKLNGIIHISNQLYLKMSSYKRFIITCTYLGLMLYLSAKYSFQTVISSYCWL